MAHSSRLPLLASALAALTVVATSCDPGVSVGPVPAGRVLVDITGIAPLATDGYVGFRSVLPADAEPVAQYESVALAVSTSRGDGEVLRFRPPQSSTNSQAWYIRREYILSLSAGANADAVLAEVEALGVRHRPFGSGGFAAATSYVFAADDGATVLAVRTLPGVQSFEPNYLTCAGICPPGQPNFLHAAIPLDRRTSAVINDGVLSVAAGDTLRITYTGEGNVIRVFERVVQ